MVGSSNSVNMWSYAESYVCVCVCICAYYIARGVGCAGNSLGWFKSRTPELRSYCRHLLSVWPCTRSLTSLRLQIFSFLNFVLPESWYELLGSLYLPEARDPELLQTSNVITEEQSKGRKRPGFPSDVKPRPCIVGGKGSGWRGETRSPFPNQPYGHQRVTCSFREALVWIAFWWTLILWW